MQSYFFLTEYYERESKETIGAQFCEEVLGSVPASTPREAGTGHATDVMIVNSQSETIARPSTSHHRPEVNHTGCPKAVASFCLWVIIRRWQ
jgi:hypothetical protein